MFAGVLITMVIVSTTPSVPLTDQERRRIAGLGPLPATAEDPTNRFADDPRAARLGQHLFFDAGFSRNGEVSCATCHDPRRGFADGRPLAMGLEEGERHTPTLLNAAWHRWFFWDGRADTLWSQALHAFERDEEFGSSRLEALHRIHADETLRRQYEDVFGAMPPLDDLHRFPAHAGPASRGVPAGGPAADAWSRMTEQDRLLVNRAFANVGKAIAAYEHRLITPPSPFDDFVTSMLAEDRTGMSAYPAEALRGLRLFIGKAGCRQCHNGPLLSDREFHNIGIPPNHEGLPRDPGRWQGINLLHDDPFRADGPFSDDPDSLRGRSTKSLAQSGEHWGAFRTPSLRNIAQTAPYMHQGQFETLGEVLAYYNDLEDMVVMDHHQEMVLQPLELSSDELHDLEAFLDSLTSPPLDADLLGPPVRMARRKLGKNGNELPVSEE